MDPAAANVFHRLGISVTVFEKFPASFEKRGSSLGYVDVDLWEYLRGTRMIRFGKRASRSQGAFFYGDLWQYLYEGLPTGCVKFNRTITELGNDILNPTIHGSVYDAVVIADGGWSSYVNGDKEPEYAGYTIWRAKVALEHLREFRSEGAYDSGQYFAIALRVPTCDGQHFVMGGVAVETPESEVVRPQRGASRHTEFVPSSEEVVLPDWFLPFVRQHFSRHAGGEVVRWLETCAAKGKITPQPLYEFMVEDVVRGRIIMIGDAAHMASPRTAAGAHTGVLDAAALLEAFSHHPGKEGIDEAIRAYEPGGKLRARQLYQRSKEVSRPLLTKRNGHEL